MPYFQGFAGFRYRVDLNITNQLLYQLSYTSKLPCRFSRRLFYHKFLSSSTL